MTRRLLLIFFVLTFAATAGTITYDWQTELIRTPDVPTVGPSGTVPVGSSWNSFLSFPLWNPLLFPGQKLDSVQFTIWGQGLGSIELSNSSDTPVTLTATNNIEVSLALPGGMVIIALPSFSTGSQTIGKGTVNFGPYSEEDSDTSSLIKTNLGVYQGSGFLDLSVNGTNTFSITGGGDGARADIVSSQAVARGSVTYNYIDAGVPEPAMLTLVGGGLLGLGFFARRRRNA